MQYLYILYDFTSSIEPANEEIQSNISTNPFYLYLLLESVSKTDLYMPLI
jgi:hypothetical protein